MTPDTAYRRLVLRVNELFHDLEGETYDSVHPEIFQNEVDRWDRILGERLSWKNSPMTLLDIGTGTGFVGDRLLPHLRDGDMLICADISEKMLQLTIPRLQIAKTGLIVKPLKMKDETLALPDDSVDMVMMNSVLHHIPDTRTFLLEINRVLRPDGYLIIGHEPNNRFFRSILLTQFRTMQQMTPKRLAALFLKRIGLYKRVVAAKENPLLKQINKALFDEGLIAEPLTHSDLSALIDVHSPTAGGIRKDEGFDPFKLMDAYGYRTVLIETYNHLSKLSGRHALLRPYEWLLRQLLPKTGATFFLVTQKA